MRDSHCRPTHANRARVRRKNVTARRHLDVRDANSNSPSAFAYLRRSTNDTVCDFPAGSACTRLLLCHPSRASHGDLDRKPSGFPGVRHPGDRDPAAVQRSESPQVSQSPRSANTLRLTDIRNASFHSPVGIHPSDNLCCYKNASKGQWALVQFCTLPANRQLPVHDLRQSIAPKRRACAKNWLNSKTNLNRLPAFLLPDVFPVRVPERGFALSRYCGSNDLRDPYRMTEKPEGTELLLVCRPLAQNARMPRGRLLVT